LENTKEAVAEFEKRMSVEIKWQEKVRRNESLGKLWKVKLNSNAEEFRKIELPRRVYGKDFV